MNCKILIAEDENSILRILKKYFEQEGYQVFDAANGKEALEIFKENEIDLACLDVMMPEMSGLEVAKIIRSTSNIPIIILTALGSEEDILKGYALMVDDYMIKPFNPKVLLAKANALLARTTKAEVKTDYRIGQFTFNFISEEAYLEGRKLNLRDKEFALLGLLVKNEDKICSRNMILDEIWGQDQYVDSRTIDTYVKNIRKELGNNKYITTIFKKGYRFNRNI